MPSTDVTIVLDRSGSMSTIKDDTIGGFNAFIDGQKTVPGDCTITLIQFDSQNPQEVVVNAKPVADVVHLSSYTFVPRADTPLYDAIGQAIVHLGERLSAMPESTRPERVIFVIITDGYENASHEYNHQKVLGMIKHQTETYKWEFVYLGANQDAMQVGHGLGIPTTNSMTYGVNPNEVKAVYTAMSANVRSVRTGASNSMAWAPGQRTAALDKDARKKAGPATRK